MVEKLVPTLRFLEFNENWEEKSLGEILSRRKEKHKISKDTPLLAFAAGQGVIDRSERKTNNRDFLTKDSKNKTYLLTEYNDIVYNPSNLKYGAIDRNSHGKGVISPIYVTFVSNVSPLFMEYIVKSYNFKQKALKYEEGTVIKRQSVHPKDLVKIKIKIPKTESERIKIGTFLSSIDKKMELLEKKHDKFQNFKKYLMQQIFTQKLRFADYIDEWKTIKLKDIGEINTGNTPSTAVDEYYSPKKYLWVTPSDISKKYIFDTAKGLSDEGAKKGRFVKKNSVLVTCIASIGKNCIILEDGYFNQQINSITPSQSFDLEFIYYLIDYNSQKMKNYAGITATPILNKKSFENMKFEFPSFNEQKQIGNILSKVDDKIFSIEEMINKTQKYKKGLLQQMFNNVRLVVINLIINEYICPL